MAELPHPRGRGAAANPVNRFTELVVELDTDAYDNQPRTLTTQVFDDASKSILTKNDSPDLPFRLGLNPYRGCEHGCIYCYARPTHEFFDLSLGLDFETKIFAKRQAPLLLRQELSKPRYTPQIIAMSGITDCYQPVEKALRITRGCLEVLAEFRNPVILITKNQLITRDIDVLLTLQQYNAVEVAISITTLDNTLAARMEPRASGPQARLRAISQMREAGIPVGVMLAPVIPGLTDEEMPAILDAAKSAGAEWAHYIVLRLPYGVKDLFSDWLEQRYPERKAKILHRQEELHGGRLNDADFGTRMKGTGPFASLFAQLFALTSKKLGLNQPTRALSTSSFRKPGQLSLL